MGKIAPVQPVKLFAGIIFGSEEPLNRAIKYLTRRYGPIDLKSSVFIFDKTDHYKDEMGENLSKIFIGFKNPVHPENIAEVKLYSNKIENKLSANGRRTVNIDPGYLTDAKVVLLTTKNFQHRIYLSRGIYAEITLKYRKGSFREWEWTYPDFRQQHYIDFFNTLKEINRNPHST